MQQIRKENSRPAKKTQDAHTIALEKRIQHMLFADQIEEAENV